RTDDFNHTDNETFRRLRSQLMRWTADNAEALGKATPEVPAGFHNRRRANWTPLLAISEACGWKEAGLRAALAIEMVADTFDPSTACRLVQANKESLEHRRTDRISSATLVSDLITDETGPWATWNRGKPISQRQIAGLLKPFFVEPKSIKLEPGSDKTAKGY